MKIIAPIRTIVLAHLISFVAPAGVSTLLTSSPGHSVSEADYTLDDSFWNDESPVGEVEKLLKEYRQNQEMVTRIGSHYYQIIYPVQLRHHEKMGISTREVSAAKSPTRNFDSGGSGSSSSGNAGGGGGSVRRSRTGKHFHRTSLLIKAFNHKFRLDLELNSQLLSPNIQQKHYLSTGFSMDGSRHDIEHCYYHGTVKDYPGASAAFHTCNGVSGVIHVGNETFVIHPFYGGDLSKHPHVIFEARTKANKGCANSGNLEWRMTRRQKHISGLIGELHGNGGLRFKRDVRETTKYIETAIIVDKAMFEKRNGSSRVEVVHDAIQVANIADLYFRTLNTRVSVVYIETWQSNQIQIGGNKDISKAISNFNDYTARNLFKTDKDTTQLLTGETFSGGEAGMAIPETVCTTKAVGISVDINIYEPHLLAGTMAHMIGHNIGMSHDDGREECFCRDWHGCIMAQSIVGSENVQPYKFSECSKKDYIDALRIGSGLCLLNKPNQVDVRNNCGNNIVEDDEECDCGNLDQCENDACCDGITCKLKMEAKCATGLCCENCKLKQQGTICRDSKNECDIPEYCTGETGMCPRDVYKKNGNICGEIRSALGELLGTGYCFNGDCPTLTQQCISIWGYGGAAADRQCYDQFNTKGSINGHCGSDVNENYLKCDPENVFCGTLQCKEGERQPLIEGMDKLNSRTIISIKGVEYECKATSGTTTVSEFPKYGLVKDGTPCGEESICVNQTCVSLLPHIDQTKCPTNHQNNECFGHGVCTNTNRCFCDMGFTGPDCSIPVPTTTISPNDMTTTTETSIKMEKKETPYGDGESNQYNTIWMVVILVVIVKGVFICFAVIAFCFRPVFDRKGDPIIKRKSPQSQFEPPYTKKPSIAKNYPNSNANHHSVEEESLDGSNKLITYSNTNTAYRDHKNAPLRRSTGEDDSAHLEKGILKKHGYGFVMGDHSKEKWGEDQSDNLELISQQHGDGASGSGVAASDVERTLKSLNGYHEDILEALRNAASHRGTGTGNTPSHSGSITEDMLRKSLQECGAIVTPLNYGEYKRSSSKSSSKENICDNLQSHTVLIETGSGGGGGGSAGTSGQGGSGINSLQSTLMHHHRAQHLQQQQQQQQQNKQLHQQHQQMMQQQLDEDDTPATGPLRIRNLEDLIRQLEHHSSTHMSPSGSEDIRMSETEADRHYRLDSSAACSESSQGSNQQLAQSQKTATILPSYNRSCRPRSDDESRFVYGRYRHPTQNRHPVVHPSHSPHSFGHHAHHSHTHGHVAHGPHSSHHSSHTHLHQDDEGLYESADHRDSRSVIDGRSGIDRDTPDSESDDFIQAQQQLARWASEDVVSVVVLEPGSDQSTAGVGPSQMGTIHGHDSLMGRPTTLTNHNNIILNNSGNNNNSTGLNATPRDYYPSPPSTETESSCSVIQPIQSRRNHIDPIVPDDAQLTETSGRYPEYKH